MSKAELVEHAGVGIFQLTQVDILLDILVFAPELGEASKKMHILVQGRGCQSTSKSRAFDRCYTKVRKFKGRFKQI